MDLPVTHLIVIVWIENSNQFLLYKKVVAPMKFLKIKSFFKVGVGLQESVDISILGIWKRYKLPDKFKFMAQQRLTFCSFAPRESGNWRWVFNICLEVPYCNWILHLYWNWYFTIPVWALRWKTVAKLGQLFTISSHISSLKVSSPQLGWKLSWNLAYGIVKPKLQVKD